MCLYTKHKKPKTAKKDIVVYKILKPASWYISQKKIDCYVTPFTLTEVEFDKALLADCPNAELFPYHENPIVQFFFPKYCVEGQGVHAFTNKDSAIRLCMYSGKTLQVFEAIIPAGTPYWIGNNNEIAAYKLIITDKKAY